MAEKKTFVQYVAEAKTDYKYVLKFAVSEITNEMIDLLEAGLSRYELKKASSFRKTLIQESPLDFPNIKNMPVYICDVTMGYPASLDFLRVFVCNQMGISEACVAVYSENDPRQIETDLYLDRSSPEFKERYKTLLGHDYEEVPGAKEMTYGVEYNTKFLQELARVKNERKVTVVENPLSPSEKVDHSTLPKDYDGFNDSKNLNKDDVGLFGRVKKPNLLKAGML